MLCNNMTFRAYNIQNNESLVCIYQNQSKIEQWQNISMRSDFNKITSLEAAQEYTRTLDLRLSKLDYSPKKYRNFCKRIQHSIGGKQTPKIYHKTVIPTRINSTEPSAAPLPAFWTQRTTVALKVDRQNSISQIVDSENTAEEQNVAMKDF